MSITQQHTQELLNRAYVLAVAADAGLNIALGSEQDYGVDAIISEVATIPNPRAAGKTMYIEEGLPLRLQLKATTDGRKYATHIHYDCDGDDFNRLVEQNARGTSPVVLVVFFQPKTRTDWLTVSEDALTLRTACYWYYLTGPQTTQTSQVIRIPRTQLFSAAELRGIMRRIESGAKP